MNDNEIIERVAKAISDGVEADLTTFTIACHAIEAMREPSDAMVAAIHGCHPDVPDKHAYPIAKKRWQDAIAAIVGEV